MSSNRDPAAPFQRDALDSGDIHPSFLVELTGPIDPVAAQDVDPETATTVSHAPRSVGSIKTVSEPVATPTSLASRRRFAPRRMLAATFRFGFVAPARYLCLVTLLGVLSVVPVLQLAVLGYFLEVSGRLARKEPVKDCLFLLPQATRLGLAAAAIYLWTLPIQLLGYYAYAAELIDPGNIRSDRLRVAAFALAVIALFHLTWAWARGGKLTHYLWPAPRKFVTTFWRFSFWNQASDALWRFLVSLQIPKLLWLGLRGALGTLVWIVPPAVIFIGATRQGETGLAGLVGLIGLALMGVVVLYLPMLQVQFAAENRLRSMFAWRRVRQAFRSAPIAFWLGTTATLLLAIPLYLLKIEATPKEIVWLTSVVFVFFMLPAHLVTGWAMRRANQRQAGARWWHKSTRWSFRLLAIPVVFTYLFFVYLSQLTSWDGLATWVQQHAFLVPVPYVGT